MKQILTTKRLILREMTMDDLPAMREIVQDKQTMYAWGHAWSEEDTVAGLENNYVLIGRMAMAAGRFS